MVHILFELKFASCTSINKKFLFLFYYIVTENTRVLHSHTYCKLAFRYFGTHYKIRPPVNIVRAVPQSQTHFDPYGSIVDPSQDYASALSKKSVK